MTAEVITAADGRHEAKFSRPSAQERYVDFQHPIFSRIHRPNGFTSADVAEELVGFADALNSGMSELISAIDRAEKQAEKLKPEFRAEKIGKVIVEPVAKLQQVSATKQRKMAASVEAAEERLISSVRRPRSEDQIAELRQDLKLQEVRGELKAMSESARMGEVIMAAQDGNLTPLWALSDSPVALVDSEVFRDIESRVAVERDPWRQDLVAYREEVHRAVVEMVAEVHQFIRASLGRLETNHGLKAHVAPLEAFGGLRDLPPTGALSVSSPVRSAA